MSAETKQPMKQTAADRLLKEVLGGMQGAAVAIHYVGRNGEINVATLDAVERNAGEPLSDDWALISFPGPNPPSYARRSDLHPTYKGSRGTLISEFREPIHRGGSEGGSSDG